MRWQCSAALHELIAQPGLMDRAGNRVYGLLIALHGIQRLLLVCIEFLFGNKPLIVSFL